MTAPHICEDTTMAQAITNHLARNPWAWQAIAWTCLGCSQVNPGVREHCSKIDCQENPSSSRGWALQNILDRMTEELILMGDADTNTAMELISLELILEILLSPHERTMCGLLDEAFLTPVEPSDKTCICVRALGLDNTVDELAMLELEPGIVDMEVEDQDQMEVDRQVVKGSSWADEMELYTSGQADNMPVDITEDIDIEDEIASPTLHTSPVLVTTDPVTPIPVTNAPFISTDIRRRTTNTTNSGTSTTTSTVPSTSTSPNNLPSTSTTTIITPSISTHNNITTVPLTSSERRQINAKPRPGRISYQNIQNSTTTTHNMPLTTTASSNTNITTSASSSSSSSNRSRASTNQLQGMLSSPAGATRSSPPHFPAPRRAPAPTATVPAAMFWWCWDGQCGFSNPLDNSFCRHCGKSRDYRPDMLARMKRNMGE